jgi:hypothetical protein
VFGFPSSCFGKFPSVLQQNIWSVISLTKQGAVKHPEGTGKVAELMNPNEWLPMMLTFFAAELPTRESLVGGCLFVYDSFEAIRMMKHFRPRG